MPSFESEVAALATLTERPAVPRTEEQARVALINEVFADLQAARLSVDDSCLALARIIGAVIKRSGLPASDLPRALGIVSANVAGGYNAVP